MLNRFKKWLGGAEAKRQAPGELAEIQELAQIDRLVKLNNLTERALRDERDTFTDHESSLKAQWQAEQDESRKRDRLIDIARSRQGKQRMENRLNILYERGRTLREVRDALKDIAAGEAPGQPSPEQIDEYRAAAIEVMHGLRETQVACAQLEGTTSFASSLDASLRELEAELGGAARERPKPTPVEAPDYADRELDDLKRELEGEGDAA